MAHSSKDIDRATGRRQGVTCLAASQLPTVHGAFKIEIVRVDALSQEVVVLRHGEVEGIAPILVRVQSECLTGEVFGSLRCDCAAQLATSLARIARDGRGAVVYLRQEGRGIGLTNKIRAYALQDRGLDTVDANLALGLPVDSRDYAAAAAVIRYLGIKRVRLLSNNPAKYRALEQHDVPLVARESLLTPPNPFNAAYLQTKFARLGHVTFDEPRLDEPA